MKSKINFLAVLITAFTIFSACSDNDNPVDPNNNNNGGPVIKTPTSMQIQTIFVSRFPEKKSDGNLWDWDPIFPLNARPDIFVRFNLDGSSSAIFRSKTEEQADYQYSYYFRDPASANDGSLPHNTGMNNIYKITLSDDDGIWGTEEIGSVYFNPADIYNNDNAETFNRSIVSGSVTIGISGKWNY